ncbi:hypothetical protein DL93DRAFT_2234412, partial [Clavulina sp. PMI_390]
MATSSFEIGGASYTGNKIKKGRAYRLFIEWNPPDINGESDFTTWIVRASADGTIVWPPFSVKRFFNSLPPRI